MSIVILSKKASNEDLKKASHDYKNYIKITADIEKEIVAIGGEYHADAEKLLLEKGSLQKNIWGGGVDLVLKRFETNAMINLRPPQNSSTEILDVKTREKFLKICHKMIF